MEPGKINERQALLAWIMEYTTYNLSDIEDCKNNKKNDPDLANFNRPNEVASRVKEPIWKSTVKDIIENRFDEVETETTMQILQSHGRFKEIEEFARKKADYDRIVLNHVNEKNYNLAIKAIRDLQNSVDSKLESNRDASKKLYENLTKILLDHLQTLIKFESKATIEILMAYIAPKHDFLSECIEEEKKLKLINCLTDVRDEDAINNALPFLDKLVLGLKTAKHARCRMAARNMSIYLRSKLLDTSLLEVYLKEKVTKDDFDISFALLLCEQKETQNKMVGCEIELYGLLGNLFLFYLKNKNRSL